VFTDPELKAPKDEYLQYVGVVARMIHERRSPADIAGYLEGVRA
jgi:hypothetical protein